MAIAPIDLQTLFTQVDKVAKAQVSQREGQAMQQAIQGVQLQKKTEENVQQVNETQNTGEGAQKVKDQGPDQDEKNNNRRRKDSQQSGEKEHSVSVLSDPCLGKNIDISL